MQIIVDASFNGVSKTRNIFSIEDAPQEIIDELVGFVKEALASQSQAPMDASIKVTVNGSEVVNVTKPMTLAEVAAAELGLIGALEDFARNHGV